MFMFACCVLAEILKLKLSSKVRNDSGTKYVAFLFDLSNIRRPRLLMLTSLNEVDNGCDFSSSVGFVAFLK